MARGHRTAIGVVSLLLLVASVGTAADLEQALVNAAGRKRAAENGLRDIKRKSSEQAAAVRAAYSEAAARQNAWLEALCKGLREGGTTAPDLKVLADEVAAALVSWVTPRNRALGVPELTPQTAAQVQADTVKNLAEIAQEAWQRTAKGDDQRRTGFATALDQRLRWQPWEAVQ